MEGGRGGGEGSGNGGRRIVERSPQALPPSPQGKSRLPHGNAKRGLGLLRSLSNDDGDSNENVKKVIGLSARFILEADYPSRRTITVVRLDRQTTVDNSSGWMIRLKARIYTQKNYQTNYRSLPKFVPDG